MSNVFSCTTVNLIIPELKFFKISQLFCVSVRFFGERIERKFKTEKCFCIYGKEGNLIDCRYTIQMSKVIVCYLFLHFKFLSPIQMFKTWQRNCSLAIPNSGTKIQRYV